MKTPARISGCANCGKPMRATTENPWRPFCSERCKTVDLGGWLAERYRVGGDDKPSSEKDEAGTEN